MDLLNMTNRAKIHEVYRKVLKMVEIFNFQATILKFFVKVGNKCKYSVHNASNNMPA